MDDDPASREATSDGVPDPLGVVMRYHQETKHHFSRYARAPGAMDWANQPDPFRRFAGSPLFALPLLRPGDAPRSPPYAELFRPGAIAGAPVSLHTLSRFFEYSLAVSAWKQAGEVRWALRTNPSSGNLHPTEGYLLAGKVPGLAPFAALYHYAPREHALELRAALAPASIDSLLQGFPPHAVLLGFASVNWRETWKYGERAFRYCQHDVGHAIGCARIAARTLGWRMQLLEDEADEAVAALLGVDRRGDFEGAEREHPDCLAVVWPADPGTSAPGEQTVRLPLFVAADAVRESRRHRWHGKANRLSRDDPVRWPSIEQVELASRKPATGRTLIELPRENPAAVSPGAGPRPPSAAQLIRQRRSALAFDGRTAISADRFCAMLARVMPQADRDACRRPMPWDTLPWDPAIHLALFVHRVEGLVPGIYLLLRDPAKLDALRAAMHRQFAWTPAPGGPAGLPLYLLEQGDARRLATHLSCRQDIAGDGAFSMGMIAEFEPSLRRRGPWFYRRLFWETGVIGQVLYLEAEAAGLRATGIGCFFDDPVHAVLGLDGGDFQSLYHFAVGAHVEDPRLTTLPPYAITP
jgi:SagB-type dehydrogenase family enzyme